MKIQKNPQNKTSEILKKLNMMDSSKEELETASPDECSSPNAESILLSYIKRNPGNQKVLQFLSKQ